MLPSEIPIFPLPNVVLFPSALLPLHIFEPRYRAMVADALESERLIGLVMLRPGWESHYDGTPEVYPIGCAGFITHADRLPDGRFNIMLRGLEKFRILDERPAREGVERYRIARIESIKEAKSGVTAASHAARQRLEKLLARKLQKTRPRLHPEGRARRRSRARDRPASRTAREAGAARVQQPARAVRSAGGAAGNADDAAGQIADALAASW